MRQMIGVLAELERSLIIERTRAGVNAAKRRGVKFGRKSKLTAAQIAHARKMIENDELRRFINVYLNDEDIRYLGKDATPAGDTDTLSLVPSIAGGATGGLR